jgi:hypothetical protein
MRWRPVLGVPTLSRKEVAEKFAQGDYSKISLIHQSSASLMLSQLNSVAGALPFFKKNNYLGYCELRLRNQSFPELRFLLSPTICSSCPEVSLASDSVLILLNA